MVGKIVLFLELMVAFVLLFYWMRGESIIHRIMHKAYEGLEQAAEKRMADHRAAMMLMNRPGGFFCRLEQQLLYSGLLHRFPSMTPEKFVAGNLLLAGMVYLGISLISGHWWMGLLGILGWCAVGYVLVSLLIAHQYNAVDRELLKFLDFLGNYSITSGELTSILSQISGYLENPLKVVLEECYYEAQTTGDTSVALLSMAEKIQHPKFKELVHNMEITMRYCADFTILVNQSRKAVREHMRMRQERKSLAAEAWVNILILGVMTVVILKTVEALIGIPMKEILFDSWPGRICLSGIGGILFLFYRQIRKLDG